MMGSEPSKRERAGGCVRGNDGGGEEALVKDAGSLEEAHGRNSAFVENDVSDRGGAGGRVVSECMVGVVGNVEGVVSRCVLVSVGAEKVVGGS